MDTNGGMMKNEPNNRGKEIGKGEEDCLILDYDPCDSFKVFPVSQHNHDPDISLVAEKLGQVACKDFPHSRHHCAEYPFGKTSHETYCKLCYCCVCDVAAPCKEWLDHCHATHKYYGSRNT